MPRIEDIEFSRSSLYDVLSGHYNLVPASAHETHYAFAVGGEDAALLHLDEGSGDRNGTGRAARRRRALEYVRSVMRADRYKIVLDLVRQPVQRT